MGRIASESGDDERGVCAGAGPLLDDVAFVAFENATAVENDGRGVFFQVSGQTVSAGLAQAYTTCLKATLSVSTKRWWPA